MPCRALSPQPWAPGRLPFPPSIVIVSACLMCRSLSPSGRSLNSVYSSLGPRLVKRSHAIAHWYKPLRSVFLALWRLLPPTLVVFYIPTYCYFHQSPNTRPYARSRFRWCVVVGKNGIAGQNGDSCAHAWKQPETRRLIAMALGQLPAVRCPFSPRRVFSLILRNLCGSRAFSFFSTFALLSTEKKLHSGPFSTVVLHPRIRRRRSRQDVCPCTPLPIRVNITPISARPRAQSHPIYKALCWALQL